MKRLVLAFLLAAAGGSLSTSHGLAADARHTAADRPQAQITKGPQIERTTDSWAIIRWTTNNIKGTALRFGVVHYGTDPHDLGLTAKSPNRWNPGLPLMIYRVQMNDLEPATTYYYRVESENALNVGEGPESAVNKFTTERSP
jgi:phosphodiesterase/alkaline phosphatase D-like protein